MSHTTLKNSQHRSKKTAKQRDMDTGDVPKLSFADRFRLRFGQGGAHAVAIVLRVTLYFVAAIVSWVTALAVATRLVPDMITMVLTSIEVPQGAPVEQLVVSWVIPALFVAGLLLMILWTVLRLLWRWVHRVANRGQELLTGDPSRL